MVSEYWDKVLVVLEEQLAVILQVADVVEAVAQKAAAAAARAGLGLAADTGEVQQHRPPEPKALSASYGPDPHACSLQLMLEPHK